MNKGTKKALLCALFMFALLGAPACGKEETVEPDAYERGMDALEAGDLETAMNLFKTSVDQDTRIAEAYRGEGIVYMRQEAYVSAITMFERSLDAWGRAKSKDAAFREDVQYYLAEAQAKSGQAQAALELYTDLTSGLAPDRAYLMRGVVYAEAGDVTSAMEDFDQVVKNNPSYDNCICIYEALSAASHKADGAEYLKKAAEDEEDETESSYKQGLIYYYLGNYDAAKERLKSAADAGNADAISMFGKVCIETGDTAEARRAYEQMIRSGEMRAMGYNGLAMCDIADGEYDEALENVRKGIDLNDAAMDESLRFNEIVIYENMLDFQAAKEKMEEFLQKYPDNERAKREQLFLQSR